MKNLFDLKGKIAVVTGGNGLLGTAFVQALASYGAIVYSADISSNKPKRLHKNISAIHMDICSPDSVATAIKTIVKQHAKIDIWVNNAYPRTTDWGVRFEDIPVESWRKNVDMHLNGYFICCQKIATQMKKQKSGSIINMGSIYGVVGPDFSIYEGTPMTMPGAYSAIKGGILNFTRYLASYYGKDHVRVNAISPGGIKDKQPKSFITRYNQKCPLGRMGEVDDIIGALIYLASDASGYMTGQNLCIDGGWTSV